MFLLTFLAEYCHFSVSQKTVKTYKQPSTCNLSGSVSTVGLCLVYVPHRGAPCWRRMSISQGVIRPSQPDSAPPSTPIRPHVPDSICDIVATHILSRGARPIHFYANSLAHKAHMTITSTGLHNTAPFIEGNATQIFVFKFQLISYLYFWILPCSVQRNTGCQWAWNLRSRIQIPPTVKTSSVLFITKRHSTSLLLNFPHIQVNSGKTHPEV
jgi:hypothetical protein